MDRSVEESIARTPNRQRLVKQYCWTIPDPETVAFVAKHANGGLVDPIAGTGYWAYLLEQLGVDVVCYDVNAGSDKWHGDHAYVRISAKDCAEAMALHPDRTLFLSWPPLGEDVGARTLLAYRGSRVIYVGDARGGATGDDQMHLILDTHWTAVNCRQPVQWWGQHDCVTLYERRQPAPPDGEELRAATTG
ncbi:hypothetical protein A5787_22025 [Mycobacterium sp. 852002-50816_SCH5313054-b]|uniref:hypothetical protein n=1 Tax=Mycobacterium sp. 852002-50816_SCH5313054-b TaxID=1834092 RepID=UPI0007FDE1B9|nr:hypothetical protein [Mycobacterium sp. 852002-50816_SCH5313054-b]OBF59160.1 hypothetical protein A5787_22025 [Mycobacterium sp. 852002-50816_SCH5313054-b]